MDLLSGMSAAMIEKASEQMISHFEAPINKGAINWDALGIQDETPSLGVGMVAILKTMKNGSLKSFIVDVLESLDKSHLSELKINEIHFKKEFSSEEKLELFLYKTDEI